MKNLENKKKYTNEDYVDYINSIIGEEYQMYTKSTIGFKTLDTDEEDKEQEIIEVPVETNVILHKTCGHEFWMQRNTLLSKIKKRADICPHCKTKIRK